MDGSAGGCVCGCVGVCQLGSIGRKKQVRKKRRPREEGNGCVSVCVRVWEGEGGAKDGEALKRGESKVKYTVGPVALFVVGSGTKLMIMMVMAMTMRQVVGVSKEQ